MPEREPNNFVNKFKGKVRPLSKRVAFPMASVILAAAAACSNGDGEPTQTPTETPTFTPEPTATEMLTSPKCSEESQNFSMINKLSPEQLQNGTNAKVAMISSAFTGGGIYLTNLEGTEFKKIADSYYFDATEEVIWSPKGHLLIASIDNSYVLLDLNGNRLAEIRSARSVSWSPDELSVFYDIYGPFSGIYELNLVSGKNCQIIESDVFNDVYPVASPDGSKLIFNHVEYNNQIMLLNLDKNETNLQNRTELPRELARIPYGYPPERLRFQWTPDSSKVVFSLTKEGEQYPTIFVADVIKNSVTEVNTNNIYPFSTLDVDLSHDGTKIVFIDESVGFYVMNIDGTNLKKIHQGERGCWVVLSDLACLNPPRSDSINKFRDQKPRWSPDDKQIGFIGAVFNPFYIINSDGSAGPVYSDFRGLPDYPTTGSVSWVPSNK